MEELVGRFFPCSEWFVLRSSSLFLVGALEQMFGAIQQMEELLGRFIPCSEWFVIRSSSLFLVGALEQMLEGGGKVDNLPISYHYGVTICLRSSVFGV